MRVCAAQIEPIKGNVLDNIKKHIKFIDTAIRNAADLIFFPELSLTGYEPQIAQELASHQNDQRFDDFQRISNLKNISIGVGMPTSSDRGVQISMIIFQPNVTRLTYSKQHLHVDEQPFFVNGSGQVLLSVKEVNIAPAICYESLLPQHAEEAHRSGAQIYMASVAKSANGVEKAYRHYPAMAAQYSMPVLMANSVGACDDFWSMGQSSVWNKEGLLIGQLGEAEEGLLIYDSSAENTIQEAIR